MIALMLTHLASMLEPAASLAAESEGSPAWLLILGPVGGGGTYFLAWRYYRNTHKSHDFERETRIEAQPVTGNDTKVDEVKGTRNKQINGDNHDDHRRRVQRIG